MGEAKRRRLTQGAFQIGTAGDPGWGANGVTVVGAVYKAATFSARVQVEDVPGVLQGVLSNYKAARTQYLDAKDWIVGALKRDEHMVEEGGYALACTLLWCFCVGSPEAEMFKQMALQGGHMLVYEITGEVPGPMNFRTIVAPADTHPLAHLFPDPRDMPTVGRA